MLVLYYIFILIVIIYLLFFRTIEGMYTLPNTYINEAQPSNTLNMFGFYKGKGVYKKNYISSEKNKEKISLLNSLLDRLLNRIVNNNQNCIGKFSEYSECDKSCGEGGVQKRTYKIIQEKGENGESCKHEDGYEETINCPLDYCLLDDLCETNKDCESKNCGVDSGRCEEYIPCDKNNLHGCDQDQCRQLNEDYSNASHMLEGKYLYDLTTESCFFKTPAEVEKLNLDIYTYNFRSLSKKAKELGLECNWYQQKNEDTKICENYPNIVVDNDNNEVKCLDNWAPQPTFFNASNSCNECKFTESEEDKIENFDYGNCRCKSGSLTPNNGGYTCEVSGVTNKLCENTSEENYEFKIQNVGEGCSPCDDTEYLLYQDSIAQCLPCPDSVSNINASVTLENGGYRQLCNESQEVNCPDEYGKPFVCESDNDMVKENPECQSCIVKKINISSSNRTYTQYDSGNLVDNYIFKIEGINNAKSIYGNERIFYSGSSLSDKLFKIIFIQNTAFTNDPDYNVSGIEAYQEYSGKMDYKNNKSIYYKCINYSYNDRDTFHVKNNTNNDMYICIFNNNIKTDKETGVFGQNADFTNKLLNIIFKDPNGYRPLDILKNGCSPNNPDNYCPCENYNDYIEDCTIDDNNNTLNCYVPFGGDNCSSTLSYGNVGVNVGNYLSVNHSNTLLYGGKSIPEDISIEYKSDLNRLQSQSELTGYSPSMTLDEWDCKYKKNGCYGTFKKKGICATNNRGPSGSCKGNFIGKDTYHNPPAAELACMTHYQQDNNGKHRLCRLGTDQGNQWSCIQGDFIQCHTKDN
jgi:hypothetical protein